MTVPIFINCRDRLEPLLALLDYLEQAGQDEIYLLDNDSAYPPLLEYFADTSHNVIRLGRNVGRLALWETDVLFDRRVTGRFVFSDPDVVPDRQCPLDAIEYFAEILDAFPDREKAGFGLKIDDLPDTYGFKNDVIAWESQFWERPIAPRLYDAPIDTTFALYRGTVGHGLGLSIRTGHPYVARHTSWYVDDGSLPDDEAFYRRRSEGSDVNHWGREALPDWLAEAVAGRLSCGSAATASSWLDQVARLDSATPLSSSAWHGEPIAVDEVRYTPWAEPGWRSWNDMSPEVEICDFAVALVDLLRPKVLIETGTGQGFITRRIRRVLQDGQQLTCFESDSTWREALRALPFFDGSQCLLSIDATPDEREIAAAGLCVLDSDFPYRLPEIERWWRASATGAVLFVHDAGNEHGPETSHALVRSKLVELGIPGFFLSNPRGAFIGVKPPSRESDHHSAQTDFAERLGEVENQLLALRSTKTLRYSEPFRRLYGRIRSRW